MLFSKDIECLYEDGFDGSNEELQIFMEVFYGSSARTATNSCHVTGATNFELEACRPINALVCSNSESSVLTAQSSMKDFHVEGSCTISDDIGHAKRNHVEISRGVTGSSFAQECSTDNLGRDEHRLTVKRMRCSGDELSTLSNKCSNNHLLHAEKDLIPLDSVIEVCGMPSPDLQSNDPTIMCHLVETSNQGILRGCYLHKQYKEVDNSGYLDVGEASNHKPLSLIGKNANEVSDSTAIVSPVSQHIIVSEDLVGGAFDVNKSGHLVVPLERSEETLPDNSDIISISPKRNILKDLNLRLRSHINNLLIATGWSLDRQKLYRRTYFDTVYISPMGKNLRQFRLVWNQCGESLFVGRYRMTREENVKQWVGINDYSSDLSGTLNYIEKDMQPAEPSFALAHLWSVLDPFVTAVIIGKQIGAIRKGKPVNVHRTVVVDLSKGKDIDASKDVGVIPGIVVGTCLYDVPVLSENVDAVPRKVLPRHGNGASVSSFCEQTTASVESVEDGKNEDTQSEGESMKRTMNQLQVSLQDQLHISNDTPLPVDCSSRHFDTCMHCNSLVAEAVQTMVKAIENACNQKGGTEICSAHQQHSCRSHHKVQPNYGGSKRPDGEAASEAILSPSEKLKPSGHLEDEGSRDSEVSNLEMERTSTMVENSLMKKTQKKSKKRSEIKGAKRFSKCSKLALYTPPKVDPPDCQVGKTRGQSRKIQMSGEINVRKNKIHENSLNVSSSQSHIANESRFKNIKHQDSGSELVVFSDDAKCQVKPNFVNRTHEALIHAKSGFVNPAACRKNAKSKRSKVHNGNERKRLQQCQIDDDDLLIAAIIINKEFSSNSKPRPLKPGKSKALRKLKSQKGSNKLLPRSPGKGGKHHMDGKWSSTGARTVVSWLVDVGVIPLNDVIQFRSLKDDTVIKDGWVTKDGILCKCCSKVLSVSEFKVHAGFQLYKPCLNLFLGSGKSYTLCLLQAWSAEYKTRKGGKQAMPVDEVDQNDDTCGLCGDGGELICCDNCPSTFHQTCLSAQELPEGSWYCPNCTCEVCGYVVTDKEASSSLAVVKCTQCEHKYHGACIKGNRNCKVIPDKWFCGAMCQEIYTGFRSRVGIVTPIDDGFSWTLLRCIHGDQKVRSAHKFAVMAECNSKLAVALTIMEECFLSMVDPRTGINMIPQVIYNWGSNFARLNFQGFYTAVLEKEDEIISVATIRVHGVVAEMPLVATRTEHRRQGMCRQLINAVEEFLTSLKVERLIVAAIPSLVDTWTFGFGFEPVEEKEKEELNSINLMVFPGTTLLTKSLYYRESTEIKNGAGDAFAARGGGLTKKSVCIDQKVIQEAGSDMPALLDSKKMQLVEVGNSEPKPISTSFELPVSNFGRNEPEIISSVEHCRPRIVTSSMYDGSRRLSTKH